jgi:hypothetical protein
MDHPQKRDNKKLSGEHHETREPSEPRNVESEKGNNVKEENTNIIDDLPKTDYNNRHSDNDTLRTPNTPSTLDNHNNYGNYSNTDVINYNNKLDEYRKNKYGFVIKKPNYKYNKNDNENENERLNYKYGFENAKVNYKYKNNNNNTKTVKFQTKRSQVSPETKVNHTNESKFNQDFCDTTMSRKSLLETESYETVEIKEWKEVPNTTEMKDTSGSTENNVTKENFTLNYNQQISAFYDSASYDSASRDSTSRDLTPSRRKVSLDENKLKDILHIIKDSETLLWHYLVITKFEKKCKSYSIVPRLKTKIMNSMNIMFMNISNGGDLYKCINESMSFILKNSPFDEETLQKIIFPDKVLNKSKTLTKYTKENKFSTKSAGEENLLLLNRTIITNTLDNFVTFIIQYDNGMKIQLPLICSKYYSLTKKENKEELANLIERYYSFGFKGLFWSIHPDIFEAFEKDGTNFINIEGFASPFNNNLKKFCSLYPTDKIYGSIGNFFTVIENYEIPIFKSPSRNARCSPSSLLYVDDNNDIDVEEENEDDFDERGIRWIINPPFTALVFNMVYEAIKKRRIQHPEDEFVLMLPNWDYLKIYKYAEEEGKIIQLKALKYKMYDHMTQETLLLPVDMCLAIIYPKGKEQRKGWNGSTLDIVQDKMLLE